jgi:hypothetical protein
MDAQVAIDDEQPFRMTPLSEDAETPASERVAGPAAGLVIVAILAALTNFLGGLFLLAALRGAVDDNAAPTAPSDSNSNSERGAEVGRSSAPCFIGIPTLGVYGIVLVGGLRMRSLTSHRAATTGAWVAMLPLSPAVVIGLPVGIWALRVLGDPVVRGAFLEPRDR